MKKYLLKWGLLTLLCAFTTMASAEISQDDIFFFPENGSTQTSGMNAFMVIYEDGISLASTSDASEITITYPNGTTTTATFCFAEDSETYVITFAQLTSMGIYTITIPEGFFILGDSGEESPEITLTYNIGSSEVEDVEYEFILTPDDGDHVSSLNTISIEANAPLYLNEDFDADEYGLDYDKIVVLDKYDNIVAYASVDDDNSWFPLEDDDVCYGFTFKLSSNITEPGRYQYIIPAGYFWLGSVTNLSRQFSATVYVDGEEGTTGISSVLKNNADNGVYYNINGQRVSAPTKGVYILNGKKLLVR